MDAFIKLVPIIIVVLVFFLLKEGFSFYLHLKDCKLHEAARTGKIDDTRQLLKAGFPVDAIDKRFGLTPLHYAIRNGHVAVAQLLLENGASLTQPSNHGITPLEWTTQYLDANQQKILLQSAVGDKDQDDIQQKI